MKKIFKTLNKIRRRIIVYSFLVFGGHTSIKETKKGMQKIVQKKSAKIKEKRLSRAEIDKRLRQGQKRYQWGELVVWAHNKQNAQRKFQNLVDKENNNLKIVHNAKTSNN